VQLPTETLPTGLEARQRVSALFQTHALALKKLAFLMTGDQSTAEDIVQDAFLGLYRRWRSLDDADKALGYLRISVLNGCRSVHRVRFRRQASRSTHPRTPLQPRTSPSWARPTGRSWSRSAGCLPDSARPSSSATTWT
jgi:DNA-directed RNA polymerase specialized sigma24 family protein